MGLFKKFRRYLYNGKLNKRISNYKYVHLMFNDKFNKPFVDFLNKNFNMNEHIVLCKRWFKEHPFPEGDNVTEIESLAGLNFENNEKIICHSLFDGELVEYLYKHQDILKNKAYWLIWGGDLYNAPRDEKNDFVRKNFKGYLNDIDEDYAREKYHISLNKKFYGIFQDFPIKKYMIDNVVKATKNYIKIQINNSCDKSTLEILDVLSKFKDENIKITTILSYGQMDFKEEIIRKGTGMFKDKFTYLDKYLTPSEYACYIAQNDILILNQNRQQGLGNTIASLYAGAKVFIKSTVSVNGYFNTKGIKIYNTEDIQNISFEEFTQYQYKESNKKGTEKYLDEKCLVQGWKEVFNAE